MTWKVERHGGRATDKWRVVWTGEDECKARSVYQREHAKIRQGGVTLVRDTTVEAYNYAPRHRLRSQW